jgi:hypothetical protein
MSSYLRRSAPTGEQTYALDLWPSIPDHSLALLDRGFLQANVLVPLVTGGTNRHWLTRAKKNSVWKRCRKLGRGDELVELTVSSAARRQDPSLPGTFRARAITYRKPGFAPQTLLTSLVDADRYPADELRVLYHERWEIEIGYDELKTHMLEREEALRSRSVAGVRQEVWGILLGYNLVRREMEQIADEVDLPPTRISFIAALRYIVDEMSWAAISAAPGAVPRHLGDMRDQIRRFVLPPRREGQSHPRTVKIKMSNYALNRRRRPR